LLRPGGLAAEDIQAVLGQPLTQHTPGDTLSAPGQLLSHYAPRVPIRLNRQQANQNEVLLGFGPMACDLNLSESADLAEAAANLFDRLHQLDRLGRPIAVAPVPDQGLGRAINDRLQRAAAPRDR
jgi:L-threonylcarbamoyladenylate synthase